MSFKNILALQYLGLMFAVISALALASALIAQYGFDLQPCILCLYQRVPYAVVMILGGAAYFVPRRFSSALIALIGVVFAIGAGIAFFHVGVEQQWWMGTESCSTTLDTSSIEALRAQILGTKAARCDEVQWSLFGISMAGYNVLMSLGLMLVAFLSLLFSKK